MKMGGLRLPVSGESSLEGDVSLELVLDDGDFTGWAVKSSGTADKTELQYSEPVQKDHPRDQQTAVLISRFNSMEIIHLGICKMWSLLACGLYKRRHLEEV